jgi:alkylated DNA repair dioxygenase AlkB
MSSPEVLYEPGFLPDADQIFASVRAEITWDTTLRARTTASFGLPYNYSGRVYPFAALPPTIAAIRDRLEAHVGHPFTNCLANGYDSGKRTMGFHFDSYEHLEPDSRIAIVSLGATRPLVFRANESGHTTSFLLEPGSLFRMGRATQAAFHHALPAAPGAGPRISLTYRWLLPAA